MEIDDIKKERDVAKKETEVERARNNDLQSDNAALKENEGRLVAEVFKERAEKNNAQEQVAAIREELRVALEQSVRNADLDVDEVKETEDDETDTLRDMYEAACTMGEMAQNEVGEMKREKEAVVRELKKEIRSVKDKLTRRDKKIIELEKKVKDGEQEVNTARRAEKRKAEGNEPFIDGMKQTKYDVPFLTSDGTYISEKLSLYELILDAERRLLKIRAKEGHTKDQVKLFNEAYGAHNVQIFAEFKDSPNSRYNWLNLEEECRKKKLIGTMEIKKGHGTFLLHNKKAMLEVAAMMNQGRMAEAFKVIQKNHHITEYFPVVPRESVEERVDEDEHVDEERVDEEHVDEEREDMDTE